MKVNDYITQPALLELCAEECVELAHACLKMARKLRGENPTPYIKPYLQDKLNEESADVLLTIEALRNSGAIDWAEVARIKAEKEYRWEERIKENIQNKGE